MQLITEGEIVIKDACAIFDLFDLDLMNDFLKLDYRVCTTIHVIEEITDSDQLENITRLISSKQILVDSTGTYEAIQVLSSENSGLSFADCSVVEFAVRNTCTILSSDGSLRKISNRKGLTVHGMVWIIESLVKNNILTIEVAIDKLNSYKLVNPRAPKKEIDDLISNLVSLK
jgi:hypothetical protein